MPILPYLFWWNSRVARNFLVNVCRVDDNAFWQYHGKARVHLIVAATLLSQDRVGFKYLPESSERAKRGASGRRRVWRRCPVLRVRPSVCTSPAFSENKRARK
jgi:hypothetical protein